MPLGSAPKSGPVGSCVSRRLAGALNVSQLAAATNEVSANIAEVMTVSSEVGSAAAGMLDSVDTLSEQADHSRRQVDHFLATVRSA